MTDGFLTQKAQDPRDYATIAVNVNLTVCRRFERVRERSVLPVSGRPMAAVRTPLQLQGRVSARRRRDGMRRRCRVVNMRPPPVPMRERRVRGIRVPVQRAYRLLGQERRDRVR